MSLKEKITNAFVKYYYYHNVGFQFFTILSFILLVVAASDRVGSILKVNPNLIIIVLIPSAFIFTFCFGYFMDTFVQFTKKSYVIKEERNVHLQEVLEKVNKIYEKVVKDGN